VCFICASPVAHNSVAPCNHRTCHICALRLRALYKTKACAHCRTEAAYVTFTDDPEKRFEEYQSADFYRTDPTLGINYENADIFEDTLLLLRYNCPDGDCDVACLGWPDLHRHVRTQHQKSMCDLCTRNKKVFTHEHELFTKEELKRHEKFGDDNPGAVDQSGFKGHPECGFCRLRFYGDDELYTHCREKHERCHLCDRRSDGRKPQYFMNYNALEEHFGKQHYPCYDKECQEKKFVVFDSEMDLKAHQLEAHPNGLSKDARRDARRVDISAFDYRPQYVEPRRERRGGGGGGGGRGRDPNAEQMPAVSSGHVSRAELAHQREREIHGTQSQTSRSFGGQLSRPVPAAAAPAAVTTASNPATADNSGAASPPQPAEALSPQEQARRLRHAAVTDRAAQLLHHNPSKLEEFRTRISSFRRDQITAAELIAAFFALFDNSASDALGTLIKELAEIFEAPAKRTALLAAWSNWKAINEDYPSLPGAGPASASVPSSSSRVLRLKSSTAQSSRSAVSKHGSWGSSSSSSPNNPFPTLPLRSRPNAATSSSSSAAPTPHWTTARPPAQTSSSSTIRPAAPRQQSSFATASSSRGPSNAAMPSQSNSNSADLFPALPAAQKPSSTLFTPGGAKGAVGIRRLPGAPVAVSAWSGGGATTAENSSAAEAPEDGSGAGGGKRKGNKGKKQVLIW
jgi:hypothetical protein